MKRCLNCGTGYSASTAECPSCGYAPSQFGGFPAYAPALALESPGFRREHFSQLAEHEANNFWFRARNVLIVDALKRYFPGMRSLLEIGCGTGYVLEGIAKTFPYVALTGTEIYVDGLNFARERAPDAELLQMDARHIPFDQEFDVIGAFDVVEHIEEDEKVLAEMFRAVRPGGGVVLTVPQHPFLWSIQDEIACHVRRYVRTELETKLRRAGFTIVMTTSFVSLLLPLMAISRRSKKTPPVDFDPAAELKLPPLLNAILYVVLRVETTLIRAGLRFPVGGTRLVVARK
ncbi:methyltransferase family protein [Luteimonas cucumeris]|uniref:Methyltransferase family protein n=1 Tax=Luteimonas cucumeris TaxID=985012 RepID=A0A562L5M3_9GAMM|nr:class I SAM-dependent methyltransferase [Luteimonas cucumeris]TWI02972.1 methyltransferase family protein [Luteimonas cucumeris]